MLLAIVIIDTYRFRIGDCIAGRDFMPSPGCT